MQCCLVATQWWKLALMPLLLLLLLLLTLTLMMLLLLAAAAWVAPCHQQRCPETRLTLTRRHLVDAFGGTDLWMQHH